MGRAFEVRKAAMAKTSAAKTKVYSRFGKEIYVAAKSGIPDPEMNQSLKRIIDRAKANQVPSDIIKRAIDKAKGGSAETYTTVRYEGFGPANSTFMIDCLTDNVNRTFSDVRNCFTKSKCKLGVSGSVAHLFDHVGLLAFPYQDEEKMLDQLIEHEVDVIDLETDGEEMNLTVAPTDLYKAKTAVEELIPEVEFSTLETSMIPHEMVTLTEQDDLDMYARLTGMLDELDDVQEVYHNIEE